MELGFAWHHSKQPKHARSDFENMLENNCNSVLIAASEDDFAYWYPNLIEIIEVAKDVGLKAWVNFWAFGGVFGGEPPSVFLHHNHGHRQITAASQESVPAACINHPEFREYFHGKMSELLGDVSIDGVFLDEPHYYFLFDEAEFTCTCSTCKTAYEKLNGHEMPLQYDDSIRNFRETSMHQFLVESCKKVKESARSTEVCVCIIPTESVGLGTPDWGKIASIQEVDMFSTDPYYHVFGKTKEWAIETARRTVDTAKKHNKKSQLWLQMFRLPKGEEMNVASLVQEYVSLGVDSLFGWCYLANKGTTIASDSPEHLWKLVTDEYRKVRK
ncbi:MAG: hypothetical protein ACFFEF_08315 [Candidatus Thorarchaeota archaeon]